MNIDGMQFLDREFTKEDAIENIRMQIAEKEMDRMEMEREIECLKKIVEWLGER